MGSPWVFPRPPSVPDNPVAAGRMGWWDAHLFDGVTLEPKNLEEAIRRDPVLAHSLGIPNGPNRVINIAPLREYAFNADANAIEEITLADRIDASAFVSGTLVVRFHRAPEWRSETAEIRVLVLNMSHAPEEPFTIFSQAAEIASVLIPNAEIAPALFFAGLSDPIAAELRVLLRWEQGGTVSSQEERFALSVDLVGRG